MDLMEGVIVFFYTAGAITLSLILGMAYNNRALWQEKTK